MVTCSCGAELDIIYNTGDDDYDFYHGGIVISWISSVSFAEKSSRTIAEYLLNSAKTQTSELVTSSAMSAVCRVVATSCGLDVENA